MKQIEVVGLGSCTVDFFALVPKLIGAEEKINADKLEIHAGGVTANNLTQVARLGAPTGWFGLIGGDDNGRIILDAFKDDDMDASAIEVVAGERSSFTWIPVDRKGERCIYMFPNVTAQVTPAQIRDRFAPYIRQAKHLHTEASQLPMAPVLEAIRIAKDCRSSGGVRSGRSARRLPWFGNRHRSRSGGRLENDRHPEALQNRCARDFRRKRSRKNGGEIIEPRSENRGDHHGKRRLLACHAKRSACTSLLSRVKVVDTTGAGDAFMGGLSYALLQGWPLDRVGLFANACAALCCTKVGARAMAKRPEVEALMASKKESSAVR